MEERVPARLRSGPVREWTLRIVLMLGSLVVALLLAEGMVRAFYPVADGRANVMLDGTRIREWFPAGGIYRQVSNEYDAVTTITSKRHRVPGTDGNPDVVFVGDSFTYGYGLADDETFASIYCAARKAGCANLGLPGSGTSKQVERLKEFVAMYSWKPKEVKFFFFGMSSSMAAGSDFMDNYNYGRWLLNQPPPGAAVPPPASEARRREEPVAPTLAGRIIGWQQSILGHSHVMRRVKFHWGPMLKSLVISDPGQERMEEALTYTKWGLKDLDAFSKEVGFAYTIYLIVPVQDIIRGTHGDTLATLNSVAPKPVVPTATLFVDSPQDYYFAYDGHLNPRANRKVAEMLLSQDSGSVGF